MGNGLGCGLGVDDVRAIRGEDWRVRFNARFALAVELSLSLFLSLILEQISFVLCKAASQVDVEHILTPPGTARRRSVVSIFSKKAKKA